jgi:hypothetical protein
MPTAAMILSHLSASAFTKAVGRRSGDRAERNVAGGAGAIFDDDRLSGLSRYRCADHARDQIVDGSGRDRHNETNRP